MVEWVAWRRRRCTSRPSRRPPLRGLPRQRGGARLGSSGPALTGWAAAPGPAQGAGGAAAPGGGGGGGGGGCAGAPPRPPRAAPSLAAPRWIDRDAFVRLVQRHPADAALRRGLRDLAPGTTDDEPLSWLT